MPAGNSPVSVWPRTAEPHPRVRLDVRQSGADRRAALARDVRRGLTATPRRLPPKYFYDATGSELFDRLTRLPEYYLTRAERSILDVRGAPLMRLVRPTDVVEIGAGMATKIRPLLRAAPDVSRYVPFDVDEDTMRAACVTLARAFPAVEVHGVVGDFESDLAHVPPPRGRRLVTFFGSTIGNLEPSTRRRFLRTVRGLLGGDGRFLLGVDLMKDPRMLHAAYDDAQAVTAAFNRNVLRVVNRALGGDFDPDAFRHEARVDVAAERVEMHLVAARAQRVRLDALDLTVRFAAGESIWTESSYKFTRPGVERMLAAGRLRIDRWLTDRDDHFALLTAAPV